MNRHDESRKEQLATEVLALVEHFHTPTTHEHGWRDAPRPLARLAVPVALEGLALLSFAYQLRARRRRSRDAGCAASPRSGSRVRPAPPLGALPPDPPRGPAAAGAEGVTRRKKVVAHDRFDARDVQAHAAAARAAAHRRRGRESGRDAVHPPRRREGRGPRPWYSS